MADKNRQARVTADHLASYADPIQVRAGDEVVVGHRDDEWPAFVWCTHLPSSRAGWVPVAYLTIEGERGTLLREYSAHELSVRRGERVTFEYEQDGWCWVRAANGESGWIPSTNLKFEESGGAG